jgi:short-subunit dehydrogenase
MAGDKGWALVTGASAGLGTEFGRQLARDGYDLVLVARRRDRLEALAAEVRSSGRDAVVIESDLGAPDAAATLIRALDERKIAPALLVNNAGVGLYGRAVEHGLDSVTALLRLNVMALTELSLALGRRMGERGSGAIVNVSSTASFQPDPWMAVYGASKAFVTSLSLALAQELAPKGVHVLAHCPGPTRTEFNERAAVRAARDVSFVYMTAEKCVRIALRALRRRRRLVVTGWLNRFMAFVARRSPLWAVTRVNDWMLAPARKSGE